MTGNEPLMSSESRRTKAERDSVVCPVFGIAHLTWLETPTLLASSDCKLKIKDVEKYTSEAFRTFDCGMSFFFRANPC